MVAAVRDVRPRVDSHGKKKVIFRAMNQPRVNTHPFGRKKKSLLRAPQFAKPFFKYPPAKEQTQKSLFFTHGARKHRRLRKTSTPHEIEMKLFIMGYRNHTEK